MFLGFNWFQYDAKHRYTACIGVRNATAIKIEGEPLSVQRQKISPLLRYNFNGCYSDMSLGVPFVYKCAILVFVVLLILVGGIIVAVKHFKKRNRVILLKRPLILHLAHFFIVCRHPVDKQIKFVYFARKRNLEHFFRKKAFKFNGRQSG